MAAFKQLNSQDVIISPLEVNKSFRFTRSGSDFDFFENNLPFGKSAPSAIDAGIDFLLGTNQDYLSNLRTTGRDDTVREVGVYNSIKHLYYSNYINSTSSTFPDAQPVHHNSDGTLSGSAFTTNYDNFRQTDLEEDKLLRANDGSKVGVLSIPTGLFGDCIQPHSFKYTAPSSGSFTGNVLTDDGEGRVLQNGNLVGNIIYTHGIITFSSSGSLTPGSGYGGSVYGTNIYGNSEAFLDNEVQFIEDNTLSENAIIEFSSSRTLYETQYKITLAESEFNYSLNPSSITGSAGQLRNSLTGSEFSPYITTVGLYNDNQELIAVGKLAKPLASSRTTDTTILVNLDRH